MWVQRGLSHLLSEHRDLKARDHISALFPLTQAWLITGLLKIDMDQEPTWKALLSPAQLGFPWQPLWRVSPEPKGA
jgi:hypothetical protein